MATLTQTAYYTRKIINLAIIGAIALIVFKILFGYISTFWRGLFPPAAPPPKVCFGKIPSVKLPGKESRQVTFSLETIDENLPKLSPVANVYYMTPPAASFGKHEQMKTRALRLGFNSEPTRVSKSTKWRFVDPSNIYRILEIDEVTGNFSLKYNYLLDQTILFDKKLPTNERAVSEAKSFLESQQLLTDDLKNGEGKTVFLKLDVDKLKPVGSLSEADLIRVGLYRADLDKLPILNASQEVANVSFLISGSQGQNKRFIEVNYTYWPYSDRYFCTYPLKSVQQGYDELREGRFLVAKQKEEESSVGIRRVTLGYYDSLDSQVYLQPVFVFEGDNFLAFVPAVDPKYTE